MTRIIAVIKRSHLDFYLAIGICIIGRFSDTGRIVMAAMAALSRVFIILMILMMRHMKTDCPVIVMMMRYRSRHQHDKYLYYNG
ncbi:putative membrane protein [Proteiniphilum saccharofermentans]|uniref:Putative membrane protein n=1 Tax=Proteiniphilum saccharofermentans TaxID=1642647 RepID=A0A1R3SU64_9BACT|nr:putative membrane protein [Proteiniphilum saccharofermentans]